MQTQRTHLTLSDRYRFDFNDCTSQKGWAQIDTRQDAHYFGTWANPTRLMIVNYCEGDVSIQAAKNAAEFVTEIRKLKAWNDEMGWGCAIDGMCNSAIIDAFEVLGLSDLLH